MTDLVIPNRFSAGQVIPSAQFNANYTAMETFLNTTGVHKYQANTLTLAAIPNSLITGSKLTLDQNQTFLGGNTGISSTSYSEFVGVTGLTNGRYIVGYHANAKIPTPDTNDFFLKMRGTAGGAATGDLVTWAIDSTGGCPTGAHLALMDVTTGHLGLQLAVDTALAGSCTVLAEGTYMVYVRIGA